MDIINIGQFIISLTISVAMSWWFIRWQTREYRTNVNAIGKLSKFFSKKGKYSTEKVESYDKGRSFTNILIKDVANEGVALKELIDDINAYIKKSKGTVAFSIIQNKTERRITMLYEIATSKLSFPTQIGLMGTFAGVFVGLLMFLIGSIIFGNITDSTIQSLICGVLVSMITSCCGLWMLVQSNKKASAATNRIDEDKNEFYEWVQNELMPSVDVSMVEAIGKLHETIDQFEPTFSGVIRQFKDAFRDVTGAFGNDFRRSVNVVSNAVQTMGRNMDKINQNIDLQERVLAKVQSRSLVEGMNAFVQASQKFNEITESLNQFEKARRIMLVAAQETINTQKELSESLQIPRQIAAEINTILNRITTFEENINGLGVSISKTQMVGNALVEQIKENITAIRSKQKIAEKYADTSNEKLEKYFEEQKKEISKVIQKCNESLQTYLDDYTKMLSDSKNEIAKRRKEFSEAIETKFSVDDIRSEFTNLRKLNEISQKLDKLSREPINETKHSQTTSESPKVQPIQQIAPLANSNYDNSTSNNNQHNESGKEEIDVIKLREQEKEKDIIAQEAINRVKGTSTETIERNLEEPGSVKGDKNRFPFSWLFSKNRANGKGKKK